MSHEAIRGIALDRPVNHPTQVADLLRVVARCMTQAAEVDAIRVVATAFIGPMDRTETQVP